MRTNLAMRAVLPVLLVIWLVATAAPAASITKQEVDAACAKSEAALEELRAARGRFDAAAARWAEIHGELEAVALKEANLRGTIQRQEQELNAMHEVVMERAVELYMTGGTSLSDIVFIASSVDQVVTGQEFLESVAREDLGTIDDLAALQNDLERVRGELKQTQEELKVKEAAAQDLKVELEAVVVETESLHRQLDAECARLYDAYQVQLAQQQAAEAARRNGAAGGVGPGATPGFICPMDSGAVAFINDWGFPRSGGRTHKGTDILAAMGYPVKAVADGSVSLRSGGIGGITVWLTADYGTAYYYAHLSGYAPGLASGQRVAKGAVIGYNGNTGNAVGGPPHVHFQIHPGGGAPVNPFPTLKRACG